MDLQGQRSAPYLQQWNQLESWWAPPERAVRASRDDAWVVISYDKPLDPEIKRLIAPFLSS